MVLLVKIDGLPALPEVSFFHTLIPTVDKNLWVKLHIVESEGHFLVHVYLPDLQT